MNRFPNNLKLGSVLKNLLGWGGGADVKLGSPPKEIGGKRGYSKNINTLKRGEGTLNNEIKNCH